MNEIMMRTISTSGLTENLQNPNYIVLDVRPIAAYNGWPLQDEARGGHISGAVSFPLSWTEKVKASELKNLLTAKGVTSDKTIVIYAYAREDCTVMANRLTRLGYHRFYSYDPGFVEWAREPSLPLDRLTNYEKLVHPYWVNRLINKQLSDTIADREHKIFHVNYGNLEDYMNGHIPGAIHLDTNALESAVTWNRRENKELEAALQRYGISYDQTVILYGRDTQIHPREIQSGRRIGHLAAARAAAILMYSGVKDVRLLDGGYEAWVAAGFKVEAQWRDPIPIKIFGSTIPRCPDYFVDMTGVKSVLKDPNGAVVSIQSWPEYSGQTSGYDFISPRGRIPGAIWGYGGTDAHHMQHYRNIDNTMRAFPEITNSWQKAGITSDMQIVFYCGTGWRASEAFFTAHLMGWKRIAIYDGGWFEWSQDPSNPIEREDP